MKSDNVVQNDHKTGFAVFGMKRESRHDGKK